MVIEKDIDFIVGHFSKLFLFHDCSENFIKSIAEADGCVCELFSIGETIFRPSSFHHSLGLIAAGSAEIRGGTRRIPLKLMKAGEVFGAAALFGGGERYVSEIIAKKPSVIIFISQELLEKIIRCNGTSAINYVTFLSERVRFLNAKIEAFTAGSAEERIRCYLAEHNESAVPLKTLANSLDIGRASLYRVLEKLEADGTITKDGKNIKYKITGEKP